MKEYEETYLYDDSRLDILACMDFVIACQDSMFLSLYKILTNKFGIFDTFSSYNLILKNHDSVIEFRIKDIQKIVFEKTHLVIFHNNNDFLCYSYNDTEELWVEKEFVDEPTKQTKLV